MFQLLLHRVLSIFTHYRGRSKTDAVPMDVVPMDVVPMDVVPMDVVPMGVVPKNPISNE